MTGHFGIIVLHTGVIRFTCRAALEAAGARRAAGQGEQVLDPEHRTPGSDSHERVGRVDVGPTRRHAGQLPVVGEEEHAVLRPVLLPHHQVELPTAEGMERVGHPHPLLLHPADQVQSTGQSKGGVEGEVGRFRRARLVPVPRVSSMAELNELCERGDAADDRRHIFGHKLSVGEHFAIESLVLRPLPAERFDTRLLLNCSVDRKSRVCVRQARYSVPVRLAGRRVDVLLGAETVEAYEGPKLVATHERESQKGAEVLNLDHYLEVFRLKPGALPGATALHQARASGAFTPTHDEFFAEARRRLGDKDGTKAMVEVLLSHRSLPAEAVIAGMARALKAGVVDPAVVVVEARRSMAKEVVALVPLDSPLSRFDRPAPSLSRYDDLLEATT